MLEEEDEDVEPIINMDSIHKVVSASQSFCDVRPDVVKGEFLANCFLCEKMEIKSNLRWLFE